MDRPNLILAVESSCDETAVALYDGRLGLLGHKLYSQEVHSQHGGVVPELASRDHIRYLLPLVKQVLTEANIGLSSIEGIVYTAGPGLVGALLVGAMFARSLAYSLGIPALPVHHMEAHLLAVMLESKQPAFPFVGLLVSGGHTMLVEVKSFGQYQLLGDTLDDAAGEAFDKVAKLLGLGYPGGAALSKLATEGREGKVLLPRPMLNRDNLDFSFSGLKTAVLTVWERSDKSHQTKADIAYEFEQAVVECLIVKSMRALKRCQYKSLVVAGGVSANQMLRSHLQSQATRQQFEVYLPRHEFCTDNAAMVAYTGWAHFQVAEPSDLAVKVRPRWELGEPL